MAKVYKITASARKAARLALDAGGGGIGSSWVKGEILFLRIGTLMSAKGQYGPKHSLTALNVETREAVKRPVPAWLAPKLDSRKGSIIAIRYDGKADRPDGTSVHRFNFVPIS